MIFVIYTSKNWSFIQILANLFQIFEGFCIYNNYFLYLCRQTREIYHGKIKSDKNRSGRTRP